MLEFQVIGQDFRNIRKQGVFNHFQCSCLVERIIATQNLVYILMGLHQELCDFAPANILVFVQGQRRPDIVR